MSGPRLVFMIGAERLTGHVLLEQIQGDRAETRHSIVGVDDRLDPSLTTTRELKGYASRRCERHHLDLPMLLAPPMVVRLSSIPSAAPIRTVPDQQRRHRRDSPAHAVAREANTTRRDTLGGPSNRAAQAHGYHGYQGYQG